MEDIFCNIKDDMVKVQLDDNQGENVNLFKQEICMNSTYLCGKLPL